MAIRKTPGPEFFLTDQPKVLALVRRFDDLKNPAIVTDPDANILWTNRAIHERSGFSREEALGRNPGALWGGHMSREFYEGMWRTIKDDKRVFIGKLENRHKEGKRYWQYIYIAPILDDTGEVRYFVAFEFDAENPSEEELFVGRLAPIMNAQRTDPARALEEFLALLHIAPEEVGPDMPDLVDLISALVASVRK